MAEHQNPAATSPQDRLQAVRTWSITLGISAVLTAMYAAAVTHYGAPHFDAASHLVIRAASSATIARGTDLGAPLLCERHDLAASLDRRPSLVEIRDQPRHVFRPRAMIERRAVGKLVVA